MAVPPDPDASPAGARDMGVVLGDHVIRDQLGGANDLADFYAFTVAAPFALKIQLRAPQLDAQVRIFNVLGEAISPSFVSATISGADAGSAVFLLDPGVYFLRIAAAPPVFSTFGDAGSDASATTTTNLFASSSLLREGDSASFGGLSAPSPARAYTLTLRGVLQNQIDRLDGI